MSGHMLTAVYLLEYTGCSCTVCAVKTNLYATHFTFKVPIVQYCVTACKEIKYMSGHMLMSRYKAQVK